MVSVLSMDFCSLILKLSVLIAQIQLRTFENDFLERLISDSFKHYAGHLGSQNPSNEFFTLVYFPCESSSTYSN